jgi:hypothetical protein
MPLSRTIIDENTLAGLRDDLLAGIRPFVAPRLTG